MVPAPEPDLIAQARQGDEGAFRSLVEPYLGLLFGGIRRILRVDQDAQDAFQEALLNIYAGLPNFQGSSRFSTWAYRICINEALMFRRSQQRRREESFEEWLPLTALNGQPRVDGTRVLTQDAQALEALERDRLLARISHALKELPEEQRLVFIMRDLEDLDTQEVADLLGISRALVRQRLHRARLALRERLQDFMAGLRK